MLSSMKKVILIRHGKSSWDNPALDDHDRPLSTRGRDASPVIASWLAGRGHCPDLVLCSSSLRTRETVDHMAPVLSQMPAPQIDQSLYHASPKAMLETLRGLDDRIGSAMIVGHNPGLGALTRKLAGGQARPRCARAFEHFPTAAAAVLVANLDSWKALAFGNADFVDFAKPRELAAAS
ncbi:MAG: histidine phosphatase family protein [Pseudomonadota bacterium]